ncbi:MAG: DUF4838 domain-containing protein [Kiritimatiellae bacterium]|nr:DUF4838 domain-containing protein [Kiritimatiellia bacterium]
MHRHTVRLSALAPLAQLMVLAAVVAPLGGTARAASRELTLVKEGVPTAVIVLAAQPTKAAQLAAFELQHHVRLVTQAEVPIVTEDVTNAGVRLLVGESAATRALGLTNDSFANQEYLIRFLSDAVVLMGRDKDDRGKVEYDYVRTPNAVEGWPSLYDEHGTMYAAHDFLEKYCGVKWINPTDSGTLYETRSTLQVKGGELRRRPAMTFRGGSAAYESALYQYAGGLWNRGTDGARAYMAAAYPRLTAAFTNEAHRDGLPLRAQNRLFQYRMKAGGELFMSNHSFYNFYERFLKSDHQNFEGAHPEYFAQGYDGEPPQLCYANPATIAQVVADIRDYFDHGGYRKVLTGIGATGYTWGRNNFSLEPMDNAAFCRCSLCTPQYEMDRAAGNSQHSTYWFRFVNSVAREIGKSHPDKFVSTLAYMTHEGLPTGFGLEPNVAVHFCISGNRMGAGGSELYRAQFARLTEWRKQQPATPMYLWLYNTFPWEVAYNGRFYCYPGFFAEEAARQLKSFAKLGVQGIFHCGFNGEVENYITYRLMDDPTLDADRLMQGYFAAYGKAAKPMRAWYELAERRFMDPEAYPLAGGKPYQGHQNVQIAWEYLGNARTMARLGELFDRARRAETTGDAAKRLALWDKGVWSYMQQGRATFLERMQAPIPSVTAPRVAAAKGDPAQVDWAKAADVGDKWYLRGGKDPSKRTFKGRVCHDGDFFYLELVEEGVSADRLVTSPQVFPFDVWEPLFARQRAQPFRQYGIGPSGSTSALSYGEINWRQCVPMTETGIRAVSDTTGNRWVSRLSWPLATIVDQPVKPGETLYMNILRTSNRALTDDGSVGIDTWVPYCTVREVDRLGEVKLAP